MPETAESTEAMAKAVPTPAPSLAPLPRRSSWAHLGILVATCVAFALVWGTGLLLVFHPGDVDWNHLERLPRPMQDAYTNGLYAFLPVAVAWFWKGLERRPWRDLGLRFVGKDLLEGLVGGVGCIVLTYGLAIALGWTTWRPPGLWPWRDTGLSVLAALLMGLVEEGVFRGIVLRTLLRDQSPGRAIAASAIIFALCHLLHPGILLADAVTGFVCLTVTGVLFGYAAWSRSLWLAMGLHAPWIFFITLSSHHDLWAYRPDAHLLTGNGYPPRGLLTLGVMGVGLAWLVWRRKASQAAPATA
ncbi:MAG: CPBP family intramembrane glutamic endopeptidase [bacterium]|nr:CPBP family intramembrane glutamic endopeptidase [bacterium]